LPTSLPGYPRPSLWRSSYTQSGSCRLGVAEGTERTANSFGSNCLILYVLTFSYPRGAERKSVLSRGGLRSRSHVPCSLCPAGFCTPNSAPPPCTRVGGAAPPPRGSSASQPPVVFRPYPPWVVGAGSGRVPGPKFAAGTAAGAAGGFLGHRKGQKFVEFCPLGGAHQSAWSLYIMLGHTLRRRRPAGA
jgi:hypothetical protein